MGLLACLLAQVVVFFYKTYTGWSTSRPYIYISLSLSLCAIANVLPHRLGKGETPRLKFGFRRDWSEGVLLSKDGCSDLACRAEPPEDGNLLWLSLLATGFLSLSREGDFEWCGPGAPLDDDKTPPAYAEEVQI